jgi:hypothetical protein
VIEYLRTDGDSLNISYTAPANTVSIVYSVYDLDNDQYIQYDQTDTVVSNVFTLTLNSDTTAYDRKLKIDIQGIKTNDSFTDEVYISLVRPYATAEEIAAYTGLTITTGSETTTALKRATFEKFEKKARLLINARVNDNFGFEYKTVPTLGLGTDLLHLGERIESYDKITSDDVVIYDSTLYESVDDLTIPLIISESHYGLRTYQQGVNISEWRDINPIYTQRFFGENSSFNIRGEYGWKYVPEAIKQATMELFTDLLCADFVYRNKGFKSIKNDSFDITFQDGILNSTGNLYVDALLEQYKRWDLRAI